MTTLGAGVSRDRFLSGTIYRFAVPVPGCMPQYRHDHGQSEKNWNDCDKEQTGAN